jgi:hypothetical protein
MLAPTTRRPFEARLARFGREALWAFYNDGDVGSLDGLWLEEMARECGLADWNDDGWRPRAGIRRPRKANR